MELPQTIRYALNAMSLIAVKDSPDPITAYDLSEKSGIPVAYLSKILRRMVTSGILKAYKGPGGGVELARNPETISFRDILEALDYQLGSSECAFGYGKCHADTPCPLHHLWAGLNETFNEWVSQTTLLDVIKGQSTSAK